MQRSRSVAKKVTFGAEDTEHTRKLIRESEITGGSLEKLFAPRPLLLSSYGSSLRERLAIARDLSRASTRNFQLKHLADGI